MVFQLSLLFYRKAFGAFLILHLILNYYKWWENYTLSVGTLIVVKGIQFFLAGLYYQFFAAKKFTFYKNAGVSPFSILAVIFFMDTLLTIVLLKAI